MRMSFGLLAAICYATLGISQSPAGLDARVNLRVPASPTPCEAHAIAQAIARSAMVPLGFEDLPECTTETNPAKISVARPKPMSVVTPDTTVLDEVSARDALNWLTKIVPALECRDVNGMLNLRPKDAWSNPEDLLSLSVPPLEVAGLDETGAVGELLYGINWWTRPHPSRLDVNLSFLGGSVVDALNSIIRGAHAGGWDAITIAHPTDWHETEPVAVIGIRSSFLATGATSNFKWSAASLANRR